MQVTERRVYVGPSLYAHFPVIRLTVDLGELEKWPSARIDGFNDKLLAALPSLEQHRCSYEAAGGFVRRLREDGGTWLGHVLEHVAIELQVLTGAKVSFGKTRGTGEPGQYHVVYEYEEESVGLEAADLAQKLLEQILPDSLRTPGVLTPDFDFRPRGAFAHPVRARPPARALDGVAGGGGRGAGHSLVSLEQPVTDPVRRGAAPEADPGHNHEPDEPHRCRARVRQGGDQPLARRIGAAGAPPTARA